MTVTKQRRRPKVRKVMKKRHRRKPRKRHIVKREPVKKKRGRKSYREQAVAPQNKGGMQQRMVRRLIEKKSAETMNAYRAGYAAAWKFAGKYMKKIGLLKPGEFRKDNVHHGALWGDTKECKLTGNQAAKILEICMMNGMSLHQLLQVRKSWSFAYLLRTTNNKANYPKVKSMFESFMTEKLRSRSKTSTLPTRVASLDELKVAFTKEWDPSCGMGLVEWSVGLIVSWDWLVSGHRPNSDLGKIKKSTKHVLKPKQGYCSTELKGGRSKLHEDKRGTRPWKVYRLCTCDVGTHCGPPKEAQTCRWTWTAEGNPPKRFTHNGKPTWCTRCPVAATELILGLQDGSEKHVYRKWTKEGKIGATNYGDLTKLANRFMTCQGANPGVKYDSNSGRKCLGDWCSQLEVPYEESFEVHGDLFKTWIDHYQNDASNDSKFARRTQAQTAKLALKAYKRLAVYFGVREKERKYTQMERSMFLASSQKKFTPEEQQKVVFGAEGWKKILGWK